MHIGEATLTQTRRSITLIHKAKGESYGSARLVSTNRSWWRIPQYRLSGGHAHRAISKISGQGWRPHEVWADAAGFSRLAGPPCE